MFGLHEVGNSKSFEERQLPGADQGFDLVGSFGLRVDRDPERFFSERKIEDILHRLANAFDRKAKALFGIQLLEGCPETAQSVRQLTVLADDSKRLRSMGVRAMFRARREGARHDDDTLDAKGRGFETHCFGQRLARRLAANIRTDERFMDARSRTPDIDENALSLWAHDRQRCPVPRSQEIALVSKILAI